MSTLTDIQDYLVAQLKADAGLAAIVDDRVYDNVPRGAEMPYISLGSVDFRPVDASCYSGREITIQIDGFARDQGSLRNTNALLDAMAVAVHYPDDPLVSSAGEVTNQHVTLARAFTDPDGITGHAVLQIEIEWDDAPASS